MHGENPPVRALFQRLIEGTASREDVDALLAAMIEGELPDVQAAGVLVALRIRGEEDQDIATIARLLRESMVRLESPFDVFVDTCGTGGDGSGTFNISTATSLVVAAAGVPVVKHGNRAVSSRSGSADVLEVLGVGLDLSPEDARRQLAETGFTFCLAPRYHPAMKNVARVRRDLGIRTVMNCVGPLANPAIPPYQVIGVADAALLEKLALAVARLGTRRTLIVHAEDGIDEVTLNTVTHCRIVSGQRVEKAMLTPEDFDLPRVPPSELKAADARESAEMIQSVLDGHESPARYAVLANAATVLWTAEAVPTFRSGVARAAEAIDSGKARDLLERLRSFSAV